MLLGAARVTLGASDDVDDLLLAVHTADLARAVALVVSTTSTERKPCLFDTVMRPAVTGVAFR
jgi:hypothetical protein